MWAPLQVPKFRAMWLGFVVSHVGDFVQQIAQNWLVVTLTHSALKVALVALAQALPRLFISVFAGVMVDRADRRKLLLVTQSLAALQSITFLALLKTGRLTYATLVVLAFALGVLDTLNLTARQTVMPTLVSKAMLPRAMALQSLGVNITQIVGPLASALILVSLGVEGAVALNALSFVLLIATVWRLELSQSSATTTARGFTEDLREGIAYVRARREVMFPIALAWTLGLLGMPLSRLLPLFSRVALHTDGRGYSLLASAAGFGALTASLAITARSSRSQLPRNILVAGALFSLALATFGTSRNTHTAWMLLFLFGGSQMAFRSAVVTLLQLDVEDRMRGRVMSVLSIDFSLWSLGATGVGFATDFFARRSTELVSSEATARGLTFAFALAGVACFAVVVLSARPFLDAARQQKSSS
jgi:MFS transporter, DHA1 family, staphyloferrin A biosynthesis exporter